MTSRVIWDQDREDEVLAARHMFEHLTGAGYLAYKAEGSESEVPHAGAQLLEFDPAAGQMILLREMAQR